MCEITSALIHSVVARQVNISVVKSYLHLLNIFIPPHRPNGEIANQIGFAFHFFIVLVLLSQLEKFSY